MVFGDVEPQMYQNFEQTPYKFVATVEDLDELLHDLIGVKELAIDLEHHQQRTYLGITSLMQMSTRSCDYIVDTLKLRTELHKLLPVFTDASVTKVLHGADMDIQWLQRDLGLYIVNMFDTGQAARALGLKAFGLAFLL